MSGPVRNKAYDNNDITLDMLHRASVVAQTKIRYNDKQLLQLVHEHLLMSGLHKTADMLKHEVEAGGDSSPAPRSINLQSSHVMRRESQSSPASVRSAVQGARLQSTIPRQLSSRTLATPSSSSRHSSSSSTSSTTPRHTNGSSSGNNVIQVRVHRPSLSSSSTSSSAAAVTSSQCPTAPTTPVSRSAMKTITESGELTSAKTLDSVTQQEDARKEVSLASIVSDYLAGQHALCKNPMSTCPEFDLYLPHKCPDARSRRDAPLNFTVRHSR